MRAWLALFTLLASGVLCVWCTLQSAASPRLRHWLSVLLGLFLAAGGVACSWRWGPLGRVVATWSCTFVACKALVWLFQPPSIRQQLTWWRFVAFTLAWVGMQPALWLTPAQPQPRAAVRALAWSSVRLLGAGVLIAALALSPLGRVFVPLVRWAWLWVGLIVLVFFGATRTWATLWWALGRPVELAFDRPIYAQSLAEWWGQRWNRPVHRVLTLALWEPLRGRAGAPFALAAVFLGSGLLHEYLLSFPARGGWGGPTLYFSVQALAMLAERRWVRHWPHSWRRSAWTLTAALLPAPLLFHPPLLAALFGGWLR